MPFYSVLAEPGLIPSTDNRQALAGDVVDVHCAVTGAPRSFVHVLFAEDERGRLEPGQRCSIRGSIRSGRTAEQKEAIVSGLRRAVTMRSSADESTVTVTTSDIDASYTMEGGALLPEPGSVEEEAWKEPADQATAS